MGKDQPIFVKDAVFKLQMSLLEGIQNQDQLFAAGSLMSRSDYEDVVTERSIANICGYPLCRNALPSDRPRKGRYRISLKEHKVYDLHETYMYCSSSCVVNSKAFAGSLQDERCSVLDPEKLNNVLRLFGDMNLEPMEKLGKDGDLGLSGLTIQEKTETGTGEASLKLWAGTSNAIEGYVPKQRESESKSSSRKNIKKGENFMESLIILGALKYQIAICYFLLKGDLVYCIMFNHWHVGDYDLTEALDLISEKWNSLTINSYPSSLSNKVSFDCALQGPKLVMAS